jgi:Holliday junction resolvase YEN1
LDEIRVVQAEKILADHNLDRESFVLFAMLAGGDYKTDGLPNCGPQTARVIARKDHGLAHALCRASAHELPAWRVRLEKTLHQSGKRLPVPLTFPDSEALGNYNNPRVTSENELRNLTCLQNGWDPKIDQAKLRVLLRSRFNMWTEEYLKRVASVFMIRQLARCQTYDEALSDNMKYDIQIVRTRQKKSDSGGEPLIPLETKISF